MKKGYLILAFLSIVTLTNAQSKWNIGVGTGGTTNISKFDGGDEIANALFDSYPYESHNVFVNFRYKICDRMSFQTGMGYAEIGSSYNIAKDYSLKDMMGCDEDDDDIDMSTVMIDIPAMMVINTPENCMKMRFIFGAGFAIRGVDNSWESQSAGEVKSYEAANTNDTYITASSGTVTTVSPAATWMIGMERMMRKGNSLSFTFRGEQGFNTVMKSTVNYTVANHDYTHTFINRGSFASFAIAYNFSPFGTRKAANQLKNVVK